MFEGLFKSKSNSKVPAKSAISHFPSSPLHRKPTLFEVSPSMVARKTEASAMLAKMIARKMRKQNGFSSQVSSIENMKKKIKKNY